MKIKVDVKGSLIVNPYPILPKENRRGQGRRVIDCSKIRYAFMAPCNILVVGYNNDDRQHQFFLAEYAPEES